MKLSGICHEYFNQYGLWWSQVHQGIPCNICHNNTMSMQTYTTWLNDIVHQEVFKVKIFFIENLVLHEGDK